MKYLDQKIITKSLVTATILLGCLHGIANAAEEEPKLSPVKIDIVSEVKISATTDLMGTIHSQAHVDVTAGVSARLDWIAQPGASVNAGDTLAKMDLRPLQLRQLEQQAQIKRAKINVRYLKNELNRLLTLRKTSATSQFQVDQAQSQYEISLTDIEISNLKLAIIDDQLDRTVIKAPFNGLISKRLVRAGTDVNRGDVLLKILDWQHLEVRVFVPVKYLAYVKNATSLALQANEQIINAAITSLIPSVDPLSQTFEIRIELPQHLINSWAAGQLVRVTVPTQNITTPLTIHRDALILRQDGTFVVKLDKDNVVKRIAVTVGNGTIERVGVTGDLVIGDRVATRGAERLTDGMKVSVQ
ncbi:MAG: efflux RND transporter periplasmic adaptor subunit [Gammaproteobacteria bacterium]|nr:efflux RND transporter periplasmic adaptor subunit [Gammaproteobacteria bacterium]